MKITLITPCFNSAETISKTIDSVRGQTFKNVEHIFMDGGSTDGSLETIKAKCPDAMLVSKKDNGIYDALNKGIALATGDVIGILHSDDWFAHDRVLEVVSDAFNEGIDFYCSKISYFNEEGSYSHDFGGEPTLENNRNEMSLAHPTLYIKRTIFSDVGEYDLQYSISSDYDWCLRLIEKNFRYRYENRVSVNMRLGGASSQQNIKKFKENLRIKCVRFPDRKWANYLWFFFSLGKEIVKSLFMKIGLQAFIQRVRFMQGKCSLNG